MSRPLPIMIGFGSLLALSALSAGSARGTESWPMYQANPAHTGYTPMSLDPSQFSVLWEQVIGTAALNPVTAADGKVFVSQYTYFNDTTHLHTLDATTGETMWSKGFGDVFSVNPPSYAYGNVYIQTGNHSNDTYLRAYDADTGSFVFRTPHSAQWERYYAPTVYDGQVYVNGGSYGGMYSFDAYSGEQNWFHGLPQYDEWTPAVDENYAYAYAGTSPSALYVLDRHTGEEVFRISDPNFDWHGWSMDLAPVLGTHDNVLVIQDGRLLSFDLAKREIAWELDGAFSGQVALANEAIYAINAGTLSVRDELTGDSLWGWEVPSGSLRDTLVLTDTHLFTQTSDMIYAIDLVTHNEVWSIPASGHLAMGEGALYVAGSDGLLTAIAVPDPATILLLIVGGVVLLGNSARRDRSRRPLS